jgi:hypothetical protein
MSSNFSDELNFNATAEWNLRYAKCASRMYAGFLTEDFNEQLGGAVGDYVLLARFRSDRLPLRAQLSFLRQHSAANQSSHAMASHLFWRYAQCDIKLF